MGYQRHAHRVFSSRRSYDQKHHRNDLRFGEKTDRAFQRVHRICRRLSAGFESEPALEFRWRVSSDPNPTDRFSLRGRAEPQLAKLYRGRRILVSRRWTVSPINSAFHHRSLSSSVTSISRSRGSSGASVSRVTASALDATFSANCWPARVRLTRTRRPSSGSALVS